VLKGPLPAGSYHVSAEGYQPGGDARLHADLILRRAGAADQIIASADSNIGKGSDAGAPGGIDANLAGPALPSTCGDLLVLRVKMVSGSNGFIELGLGLTIP
jgi:hypothetical protein